jgi:VWFA-related protein
LTLLLSATALPQEPIFRTGTNLVQVDVVVRDKKGPVEGLTRDDFTLFDNGHPQKVSVFSVRSSSRPAQTTKTPPVSAQLNVVSNRTNSVGDSPGTATILLVDQKNTTQTDQAFAIQRIAKFISERRKSDRIGIYVFGRDGILRNIQELTDDAEALSRAAKGLRAQDPSYKSPDIGGMPLNAALAYIASLITERETDSKKVLETIARHLSKVQGRKNLIWLTASFPVVWPRIHPLVDFTKDMEEVARALNDAGVALYAVDARGLAGALSGATPVRNAESGPDLSNRSPAGSTRLAGALSSMPAGNQTMPDGVDTMNLLAGRTGGAVYLNTNGLEDSMRSAVEDADLTYTLGFYPESDQTIEPRADRDPHSLRVEVKRSGAKVRYRENYSALNAAVAVAPPTPQQLLMDSLDATQIGISSEILPDQAHQGSWQVRLSVDLHDVKLERKGNSWVGELAVLISVDGSERFRVIDHEIAIPDDRLAMNLEKGDVFVGSIEAPPEILRIAVQDKATGAAGSLRIPLAKK